jgi:hypothetical protein
MSELIRQLSEPVLPSEVVARLGNFLNGQSMATLLAEQSGEGAATPDPLMQMEMLAAGVRPTPMVNRLQLDR